jgi:large subunit ribosomal protein L24
MSIAKVQKGDKIKVIAGKFKGTLGVVTKVIKTLKTTRVSVDNVNKIIKYTKANKSYGVQGQMVQVDRYLDSSNVALVDEKNNISKTYIKLSDNKKSRIFKSTNNAVPKFQSGNKDKTTNLEIK